MMKTQTFKVSITIETKRWKQTKETMHKALDDMFKPALKFGVKAYTIKVREIKQ